jgi:L-aspartate oxidase
MAQDAGVVRDAAGLGRLIDRLASMETGHAAALPLVAARLVAEAALERRESRGAHFRADFPLAASQAVHTDTTLDASSARDRRAA